MRAAVPSRRRRGWHIALATLGALAVLLVGGYVALVRAFPPQRLAALLSDQIRAATGRDFRIGGGLSIRLLPTLAVVAEDVALGNAAWGTRREMATVKRAAFEVALAPLLKGQLHVLSVDVEGADVLLETNRQGHANWVFSQGPTDPQPADDAARAAPPVQLDRLVLSDARIAYHSGITSTTRALAIESLRLDVDGQQMVVAAHLAGPHRAWRIDGKAGLYETLMQGHDDWPFDVALQSDDARLAVKGTLDAKGTVRAAVSARIGSAAALTPWFAQAPTLPMPIDASATIERGAAAVSVSAMRLSLGGQTLTGTMRVRTPGGEPQVELDIASPSIDLARWGIVGGASTSASSAATAARPAAKTPYFADTPLPVIALPDVPLHAQLRIDQLAAPKMPTLSSVRAQLAITPDRLDVAPFSFNVAEGQVGGRLQLGVRRGEAWRVTLHSNATGLSLQALEAPTGGEHLRGRADLQLDVQAAGRTPHELAASVSGRALLMVHDAALRGGAVMERNILVALLQALLPRQPAQADASLQIQCTVVNLPLKQGIATIDRSIAMETDKIAVAASGELNLAAQTVTLGFHPVAKKGLGLDPASLAKLVRLEGPLHDPKIGIDMTGTAREAANIGAAVATAGLSLVGKRLLLGPEDTQVCQHARGAASP